MSYYNILLLTTLALRYNIRVSIRDVLIRLNNYMYMGIKRIFAIFILSDNSTACKEVFWKARSPISTCWFELVNFTYLKLRQSWNALLCIIESVPGNITSCNPLPRKQLSPISSSLSGSTIFFKFLHDSKTSHPIIFTWVEVWHS